MRNHVLSASLARLVPSPANLALNKGFQLTNLIVVADIMAVLACLLVPGMQRAIGRTESIACLNNLKQLQFGWHMYIDDNDGQLPPNNSDSGNPSDPVNSWCPGNARTDTNTDN